MKKAITHLELNQANPGKLQKLDELADEYQRVAHAYVNWLIQREMRRPDKYADIAAAGIPTSLSARWQQSCGIVQSWYSNERQNPPVLHNVCIQSNANVVVIEPSRSPHFDFWLRISTLEAGYPVRMPVTLYARARETLAQLPKLCSGVTLNQRGDGWYATFIVERKGPKSRYTRIVGVDIGMSAIVCTSEGQRYGQASAELRRRVERSRQKRRLKGKNKPAVSLSDHRTESFARNEMGRVLNQMLTELPDDADLALERLSVKDRRMRYAR